MTLLRLLSHKQLPETIRKKGGIFCFPCIFDLVDVCEKLLVSIFDPLKGCVPKDRGKQTKKVRGKDSILMTLRKILNQAMT